MQTPSMQTGSRTGMRRPRNERGLALLMTIMVLSSLLILGISLSTAVKADFEEAVFYRSYNEAHIRAQEGLANTMGFLMYDVWGVNEADTFVASQWDATAPTGDRAPNKQLGSSFIPDGGGIQHAFEYEAAPLLAAELELHRVIYPNVPYKRFVANEQTDLVADWDWYNTSTAARVNQHELLGSPTAGRSRYTDAFLPTSSDVNDWFEVGLHVNRSDLHGYWRNNFPNRPADLYAGGYFNGWGYDRNLAPVSEYRWRVGWGDYHGLEGYNFPFAEGKALTGDPVVESPWNFVNTNAMIGDSFTRVFRTDLVDANYEARTYNAMLIGPMITSANGTSYGGAINLNEVNNNYELEQFPGVITPNDTTYFPAGSPDYDATNAIEGGDEEYFYYSGRSYHYNEAKWIYTYNEMGKPTGRYAVTMLFDGGLPNVNGLGNPRYNTGFVGWFPLTSAYPGLFPPYDRGYTIMGSMLRGRKSYGTGSSTAPGGGFSAANLATVDGGGEWRAWSDKTGANWIKNGSLNGIRQPGKAEVYASGSQATTYWRDFGAVGGDRMRHSGSTTPNFASDLIYTNFALGTASTDHPTYTSFMAAGELYAGPNQDIGHLKYFGQGIMSHVFWHLNTYGPVRTRSEFMMLLKKRAFMIDDTNYNGMAANGIDENPRGNGTWFDNEDFEIAEMDCQFLAGWITPIGYHYTFDSLWNYDRVIVDSTGGLYLSGVANTKSNCYFWSGIESQSRNGGDPQGYLGPCPTIADDDDAATPGPAPALAAGDYTHDYKNMHRKVKGKTGAKALLQQLAQLRYLGDGLGVKGGGYTPFSPVAERSDAANVLIPGYLNGPASIRRANAAGALSLSYLLSTVRIPNIDFYDQWRTEQRFGDTSGVVVNWKKAAGGGWDPDITIWINMNWRQAFEVSDQSDWDYRDSVRNNSDPKYGHFAVHQYMRSSPTEVGRARVYQPYYLNDVMGAASNDGLATGNTDAGTRDFRTPIQNNQQERLYLPKYDDIPYNQWMTHNPSYFHDMAGIGLRETWSNYTFTICGTPTTLVGKSFNGISLMQHANTTDFRAIIRTTAPMPIKAGDEVVISGAGCGPVNGNHVVVNVLAPNAFEIYLTAAVVGATGLGNYGGGTVNLRMTDDPNFAAGAGAGYQDFAYPAGIPLVMNYIELCFGPGRNNGTSTLDNMEFGESLGNKTLRKNHIPRDYFRGWRTDYDVLNNAGWHNLNDGNPHSTQQIKNQAYRTGDYYGSPGGAAGFFPNKDRYNFSWRESVRLHAGYGNSQPFIYVKGRLMQGDPNLPTDKNAWFNDTDGKPGLKLLINMFDQFDPIHWGVSVRECDAGGNLVWVNYNADEQHQRGVQRVFGRLVDMTWGIGEDRIPTGSNTIDEYYRWTTRAGNRGMFVRGHTPMYNQRGHQYSGSKFPFPLENLLIDMPVTMALRQLAEKHGGEQQGGPDATVGGHYNMGAYLTSFTWGTWNRTGGQDCDWAAHHWWAMDGLGITSTPPAFNAGGAIGPNIAYDGTAPILRWDSKFDRSIDGHHDAFLKAGNDTYYYLFSPSAENASHQGMTQGHPESFKVIYFHPYFFPQKIVYGNRTRASMNVDNTRYYDYVYPLMTTDFGTTRNGGNVIKTITRNAPGADGRSLVTVTYDGNLNGFIYNSVGTATGTTIPAPAANAQEYVRITGCKDSSFNGVYKINSAASPSVTFYQDGALGAATVNSISGNDGTPNDNSPAGFCHRHWAFARVFNGANYMSSGLNAAPWATTFGAGALPATAATWTRGTGMANTAWNIGAYYPPDYNVLATGRNANAQSPLDLFERVNGCVTLPDYLGIDGGAPGGPNPLSTPASKLWLDGPWWVDGDEGQGPVELTPPGLALRKGDFIRNLSTGARATVVTITGGKNGDKLILQPCAPYSGGFRQGDTLQRQTFLDVGPAPFLVEPGGDQFTVNFGGAAGSYAPGQRMWFDYGRYCSSTRNDSSGASMPTFAVMNTSVDPTTTANPLVSATVFAVPPASTQNTYLRGVLEFSVSTPWILDNNGSGMWQFNSAYCFKAATKGSLAMDPSVYGPGASQRIDPAFGNARWYLAKGTDHAVQVFSMPTPMQRNTNHIAWSASPYQRDRWANGIIPDPNRPGTGPNNPGFNMHNGTAPGSPLSQYVENKLELAIYQIGNATFNWEKNLFYCTPIGAASAEDLDFHQTNWWDLNFCTDLDSMWELGVVNSVDSGNGPSLDEMGRDPMSLAGVTQTRASAWPYVNALKQHDLSQIYTNNTSFNDFHDNNDIGIREILTITPTRPIDASIGRVEGHYNIDRKSTFKINPNLITSPILYQWLKADYTGQDQPTYVFGNKPARGFISTSHIVNMAGTAYSSYHLTNWNSRVWYKHQCIAPSAFNDVFGVIYVNNGYARMSNMLSFNPAPVYTALITGQSINDAGEAVAQIRLTVGVERTYNGKCNILEYQINAGLLGVK